MIFTKDSKIDIKKIAFSNVSAMSSYLKNIPANTFKGVVATRISEYIKLNLVGTNGTNTGSVNNLDYYVKCFNGIVDEMTSFGEQLSAYLKEEERTYSSSSSVSTFDNFQATRSFLKSRESAISKKLEITNKMCVSSDFSNPVSVEYSCNTADLNDAYDVLERVRNSLVEFRDSLKSLDVSTYSQIIVHTFTYRSSDSTQFYSRPQLKYSFNLRKLLNIIITITSSIIHKITNVETEIKVHATNLSRLENKYLDNKGEIQGIDSDGNLIENEVELVDANDFLEEATKASLETFIEEEIVDNESINDSQIETLEETYTIKSGDTLSFIANKYGVSVDELYNANKDVIGSDAGSIIAGTELIIPSLTGKASTRSNSTIFDDVENVVGDSKTTTNAHEVGATEASLDDKTADQVTTVSTTTKVIPAELATRVDRKMGAGFSNKVEQVADSINCNPNDLLGLFYSESGLNANAMNSVGAVGLIQFMPNTCKELGYTNYQVQQMSPIQQLDLVEKYFKKYNYYKQDNLDAGTLYAITFLPGRASRETLTTSGESYYKWNSGLDYNRNGSITKTDLANRVNSKYSEMKNNI